MPLGGRYQHLMFNGDERKYEMWEVRFLGYMLMKNLKEVIDPSSSTTPDDAANERAFAELITFIDERSLTLVMRDANNKGREALAILRNHYRGNGMQRIIGLYTELSGLVKDPSESVIDYALRAENISVSLEEAGEKVSDTMLVAVVLKGLPAEFKAFVAVVTQSGKKWEFKDLKTSLRDYEETEKARGGADGSSIMKTLGAGGGSSSIECYNCHEFGHKRPQCPKNQNKGGNQQGKNNKKWCSHCKTKTHNDSNCRSKKKQNNKDSVSKSESDYHTYHFKLEEYEEDDDDDDSSSAAKANVATSFLVDSGCSSHIVTDDSSFIEIDESFKPHKHSVELADGRKCCNIAKKKGSVKVTLTDKSGISHECVLNDTLYIPSYPENLFSVKAATRAGCSVNFHPNYAELVTKDNNKFEINCRGSLYYLQNVTLVNRVRDLKEWHDIMGHCNTKDIIKLEPLVDGMKIGKKEEFVCEPCILGKQTQQMSKKPSTRATQPLEFVCSDVCGPIKPESRDGFKYVISFIDNFTGFIFLYFCLLKSDATKCLEKFLADIAPLGNVQCLLDISDVDVKKLRSDGGGEYMGKQFKGVLVQNKIKHEQSAPYSPHQNGVAERSWRTLFDMGRCLLIGSKLPQNLWPYALMHAAYIRNRCYVERLSQTPYFMLTGRKPDLSNMHVFGSVCFTLEQKRSKLDPKSKRGIFVGYDKESPAYLVYSPDDKRVKKSRSVKFTEKMNNPSTEEKTDLDDNQNSNKNNPKKTKPRASVPRDPIPEKSVYFADDEDDEFPDFVYTPQIDPNPTDVPPADGDVPDLEEFIEGFGGDQQPAVEPAVVDVGGRELEPSGGGTRPRRERNLPEHLADYDLGTGDVDVVRMARVINSDDIVDVARLANEIHSIPKSYAQAMKSPDSSEWKAAMVDEYDSLKEHDTFDIVPLPEGKKLVGGRWVYAIKEGADEEIYKARFVAQGFTQVQGTDYFETFSPTAKMSSIRIMMQLAAEFDLTIHQMDVKTAFLNAPIDCEIYVKQPEGFEVKDENGQLLVLKLNKSLYGLKQSGRNWNSVLHSFFIQNKFVQSKLDPCVYFLRVDEYTMIVLVWVDDIVLASSSSILMKKIKDVLKQSFKMKDLGLIKCFLGMRFSQHPGRVEIDQTEYLKKVLKRFDMSDCKARSTPCEVNPASFDSAECKEDSKFRQIVGSLIYAMVCCRPDLSWVVTRLSQSLNSQCKGDWVIIKHVLQYVKGTLEKKLVYQKCANGLDLHGYSDSDWAGSVKDRRSTTGYCFSLSENGPPISWKSQKQSTVALSSCEAEYMALCAASKEAKFLEMTMKDFVPQESFRPIVIHVDNTGAIALGKNNMVTKRSKHIDIRYHFTRECYVDGLINIVHVPTSANLADVLTKPMSRQKLDVFDGLLFGGQSR